MAESTGTPTCSTTVTETPGSETEGRSLTIRLRKRRNEKKVEWSSDTVDNEHLGRRSSKCCCIYEKPRAFGESSTESESDDEGCGSAHCIRGHRSPQQHAKGGDTNSSNKPEHGSMQQ